MVYNLLETLDYSSISHRLTKFVFKMTERSIRWEGVAFPSELNDIQNAIDGWWTTTKKLAKIQDV
jgi:hypothetical protein